MPSKKTKAPIVPMFEYVRAGEPVLAEDHRNVRRLDAAARRAAKRIGLAVRKSRAAQSVDNWGGYMIFDPFTNFVVAGVRFDLSAEQVIDYCRDDDAEEQS